MAEVCVFQNLALVGSRTLTAITTCSFRVINLENETVSCIHAERAGCVCPSITVGRAQKNDDRAETIASRDFRSTTYSRRTDILTD